jgi:membrane protease subunit HflK
MLTKDENIVDVTVSVQYQISNPENYVLEIRDPDNSLAQATESALRHVVGSSIMDDALTTGREEIALMVKARLQIYLDRYDTGLQVVIVNIEDSSPPDQVQEAFDDVIKAREDEVRVRNVAETYANGLVPEARGQAQRMIQDAQAYREQVIAEAEGDAARFNLLLGEYKKAPEVTRSRLYLEAVQNVMANSTKVMIDVEGGNNILYLPLDKIAQAARAEESIVLPSTGTSTSSNTSIRELTNQVIEEIRRRNSQQERRK